MDPRITNRPLGDRELKTLRELLKRTSNILEQSQETRRHAVASLEEIRRRYEEQTALLRSIESERENTKAIIAGMELEETRLSQQVFVLKAQLEPIKRCPADILMQIFSEVVRSAISQLKAATTLSAVCQSWRSITLQSPSLWTDVAVWTNRKPDDIALYLGRTKERVKARPVTIRLLNLGIIPGHEIGSEEWLKGVQEVALACNLRGFQVVEVLLLLITNNAPFERVLPLMVNLVPIWINHLHISGMATTAPQQQGDVKWDLGAFLRGLPAVTAVTISSAPPFLVTPLVYPFVRELQISGGKDLEFSVIFAAFPQLRSLVIQDGTQIRQEPIVNGAQLAKRMSFDTLALTRADLVVFPWATLGICPNLIRANILDTQGRSLPNAAIQFLKAAVNLQHLTIDSSSLSLDLFNPAQSKLTSLTIYACNERNLPPLSTHLQSILSSRRQLFPTVSSLILGFSPNSSPLTVEEFETIVKQRCMPLGSANKLGNKSVPITTLYIQETHPWNNSPNHWSKSQLLLSAKQNHLVGSTIGLLRLLSWV